MSAERGVLARRRVNLPGKASANVTLFADGSTSLAWVTKPPGGLTSGQAYELRAAYAVIRDEYGLERRQ